MLLLNLHRSYLGRRHPADLDVSFQQKRSFLRCHNPEDYRRGAT